MDVDEEKQDFDNGVMLEQTFQGIDESRFAARKPYTLSKTRERWSDEEHQRFLEALRLHGRAWRKVEAHIGTKTAVQIRSHAQKFFIKLEKMKEAGEIPDKGEDISIPPPRPKRKPCKPYPRKDGLSSSGYTDISQLQTSSQLPANSQLPPVLQSALNHDLFVQQQQQQQQPVPQQQQQQSMLFQQQYAQQHCSSLEGLQQPLNGLSTGGRLPAGHQFQQLQQQQHPGEVTDATVAAVTAAASAAAAAAAAAVVAAAGQEVQMHMQAHPPSCFPFFGLPPSAFAQLTPGAPALDQAAVAAEQAAAASAAAYRCGGNTPMVEAGAHVPVAPVTTTAVEDDSMRLEQEPGGGDRNLVEATGTTDGTHISANPQPRGSDGDSACSRETDNQDGQDVNLDVAWQSELHEQQQRSLQHGSLAGEVAAAAARNLGGLAGGTFDPSMLHWGLRAAAGGAPALGVTAADSVNQLLSGLAPAQVLALYLAAANQHLSQQGHQVAHTCAANGSNPEHQAATVKTTVTRSSGGGSAAAGGAASDHPNRSKSRRTAASGNSGSSGPPVGSKRCLAAGDKQDGRPVKKVALEASDAADGTEEHLHVSPGSPSIQEKLMKAASQPSNTNGNTSGSNESDASKRRHGTTQGEGSHPASVKDSNTATHTNGSGNGSGNGNGNGHTNGNGNGTSAFHPLGHHHSHIHSHHHQQQHNGLAEGTRRPRTHMSGTHPAQTPAAKSQHVGPSTQGTGVEGSNGGNGMSGTNNGNSGTNDASGRDEGKSSSDLEGPTQQQLLERHHLQQERQAAEEDTAGGQLQQQPTAQQDDSPTTQLQVLLSNLHGVCGASPVMQAYGVAAAAAAQHMLTSALNHLPASAPAVSCCDMQQRNAAGQFVAALQQQLAQGSGQPAQIHQQLHAHPPTSQGLAAWHADPLPGLAGQGVGGLNAASSLLASLSGLSMLSQHGASDAAAGAQLAAAAAGLMGLGGSSAWAAASSSMSMQQQQSVGARQQNINTYTQLAVGPQAKPIKAAAVPVSHLYQCGMLGADGNTNAVGNQAVTAAAVAAAAAAAQQQMQSGYGVPPQQVPPHVAPGNMAAAGQGQWVGGWSQCSGLELLSRAAQSAGPLATTQDTGTPGGSEGRAIRSSHSRNPTYTM